MNMRIRRTTATVILTGVVATVLAAMPPLALGESAQATRPRSTGPARADLPGGATSLQETHGDWRVVCGQPNGKKVCALSQQQTEKDTHQLMLAIELSPPVNNTAGGTLILPFGLALDRPVTLQIDDAATGQVLRFRTCLPVGCLVALAFDPGAVVRLREGTMLTIKTTADGGQEALFKVSLEGFAAALDRTVDLSR
jgi:invasion protein IalB